MVFIYIAMEIEILFPIAMRDEYLTNGITDAVEHCYT